MPRVYRISAPAEPVDRLGAPPRPPSRSLIGRYEWDLPEREFDAIPELREWLRSQGIGSVEERGLERVERQDAALASILRVDPSSSVTASRAHVADDHPCRGCGLTTRRVVDDPELILDTVPEAPVVYVAELQSVVASTEVIADLGEKDLGRGLCSARAVAPGSRSFDLLWSDRPVGMPAAPYGDDGNECRVCGRSVVHRGGRTTPARPRFAFRESYRRSSDESQWLYNDVDGPLRPMVTAAARDALWSHDSDLTFTPLAWYPEEGEEAFLDERFQ